jgi:hypothetical protein
VTREALIVSFVKANLRLLQQKELPYDNYKRKKHQYFFDQLRNQIGKPKDSEIAEAALFYLIRKHMVKTQEELERIFEYQFFKDNLNNKKIFIEEINVRTSHVNIDPGELNKEEYRQDLVDRIKQDILTENSIEFQEMKVRYEKQEEEFKKRIATISTVLESEEFKEPRIKQEESQHNLEWWQQLNLRNDPFPMANGLQKIDRSIHDQIIVQTDIFKRYMDYCVILRDQLFKNTIFYGDYGSGKTAFFDYFREILLRNKILAVQVDLWPRLDADVNIRNFEDELSRAIMKLCADLNVNTDQYSEHDDRHKIVVGLLKNLREQKGFNDIIIIVDELHKRREAFKAVVEFISFLQIFTSNLTRDTSMNVGLYLAGVPEWRTQISTDSILSGSLVRHEMLPEISESNSYDMLNKRLIAYSKNPDRKKIIRTELRQTGLQGS